MATALALTALQSRAAEPLHEFRLHGGNFFGPGPIVPDAVLPDGRITHVQFDPKALKGQVEFANDGSARERFSDNRTKVNRNIDAGLITLGDKKSTVRLAAVAGGPNHGRELYGFDGKGDFIWRVDLALDPGFEQGIIRMNDFVLSTAIVKVAPSLQTQQRQPGGYDQAGTLSSGSYLPGRVGDFDDDGFLDGVLVAGPNVPLGSDMLPGAPVGLRRGFSSDIRIAPGLAAELTLAGVLRWREPLRDLEERGEVEGYRKALDDVRLRLMAARHNMETAHLVGKWKQPAARRQALDLTWRVDALVMLANIARSPLDGYRYPAGHLPAGTLDATRRLFVDLERALPRITEVNRLVGDRLPPEARPDLREASLTPATFEGGNR
ncbi:MAG TPA: hypothetical protein VI356_21360 [Myxococcales bacterium]